MYNKITPPEPTFERFMQTILSRSGCGIHKVKLGEPCYLIPRGYKGGGFLLGVCNKRALKNGFNNKISDKSLSMNRRNPKR